ncbi:MAG TPA: arsenate reductase [Burkholderiales bacterium]|nr:arsenate reductase [Burkholderiales bacterium]
MRAKIYGIKNCDTMKKAFAWLGAHGVDYEFHDYKKAGVPPGKLKAWAKQAGWEALANTRGPTWRKIPQTQRANLTEAKMFALLEANTSAIRRPIVEAGGKVLVGFDPEAFAKALSRAGSCAAAR